MTYINDELYLVSKKEAVQDYKNKCIEYVNTQIVNANKNYNCCAELLKKRLYPELIERIKKEFNVLGETDKLLIINWLYQNNA